MDNNEFVRRLRYALQIDDAEAVRLTGLGGGSVSVAETAAWRLRDTHADYLPCSDEVVDMLMGGLIVDRRSGGEAPTAPGIATGSATSSAPGGVHPGSTNNLRLKQLRIALAMRSEAVEAAMKAGGSALGSSEIAALFRKPEARNFRRCGDQSLRHFLVGLAGGRTVGASGTGQVGQSSAASTERPSQRGSEKPPANRSRAPTGRSPRNRSAVAAAASAALAKKRSSERTDGRSGSPARRSSGQPPERPSGRSADRRPPLRLAGRPAKRTAARSENTADDRAANSPEKHSPWPSEQ